MRLKHSIDFARTDQVGSNGVAPVALADALKRTEPALAWLRARHADSSLPLLRLPAKHDDLVSIKDAARRLTATGATDIVFLGTGGSSLGGQTLAQLDDHAVLLDGRVVLHLPVDHQRAGAVAHRIDDSLGMRDIGRARAEHTLGDLDLRRVQAPCADASE